MPKVFATHAQGLTCATTPPPSLGLLPASLPGGDASTTKLTESVPTLLSPPSYVPADRDAVVRGQAPDDADDDSKWDGDARDGWDAPAPASAPPTPPPPLLPTEGAATTGCPS